MYVCICKGISEKDIENAMITHQNSKDILKTLGVGSDCGTCLIDAIENLKSRQVSKSKDQTIQRPLNSK
jgi:bacterioferritin-associated ferredoxin